MMQGREKEVNVRPVARVGQRVRSLNLLQVRESVDFGVDRITAISARLHWLSIPLHPPLPSRH